MSASKYHPTVFLPHEFNLFSEVSFVAIKNGMHQSKGYAFFTPGFAVYAPSENSHVKNLHTSIKDFFNFSN